MSQGNKIFFWSLEYHPINLHHVRLLCIRITIHFKTGKSDINWNVSLYQHYAKVVESLEEKSERNITTQEYCTQIQLLNILSSATAQPHTLDKKMKMHYSKSAVPDRYHHFFFFQWQLMVLLAKTVRQYASSCRNLPPIRSTKCQWTTIAEKIKCYLPRKWRSTV